MDKINTENMLMVLEKYQLKTPTSDTATMPQGLRKEVREFVSQYVGHYTDELRTVKRLKQELFFKLNESNLRKNIMNDSAMKVLMQDFKKKHDDFKLIYQEVRKNKSLEISNSIYEMNESSRSLTRVDVNFSWINDKMNEEFDKLYGKGFKEFNDILERFEKKIEESVIFATITEVYKLITDYAKFEPYLKKLSDLKIK